MIVAKLLSVSDKAVCMSLNSHVVIKGPSPSNQVHLRAEDFGGSHGGHMEKFEFIWAWLGFWFWELGPSYVGTGVV